MDTHPQPHVHYEKKWKNYLYEFLMLFLAVSGGFLAENIREKVVEDSRAKQYAKSLYDDIQKDTAALSSLTKFSYRKIAAIDTAIDILHQPMNKWNDTALYRNLSFSTRLSNFDQTQGTYDQMKYSGSLRYFHQELVDLLNEYAVQSAKVSTRENIDVTFTTDQFFPFLVDLVNAEAINDFRFDLPVTHELYCTRTDKATCNTLINYLVIIKLARMRALQEYYEQMNSANKLLAVLHEKYPALK